MNNEKFTQGKWTVMTHYDNERFENEYGHNFSIVLPEQGSYPEEVICEVWGTEHDDIANAHLISASTEMYYALKECRDRLYEQFGNCIPVERANKALAKALGVKHEDI